MDENRITELWNKAVAEIGDCTYPKIIVRFAEFVAADEREACANVVEATGGGLRGAMVAHAIRERSNANVTGLAPGKDDK